MSDPIQSAISPNHRNCYAVQSLACQSSPFNQNRQNTSTFILSYFHTLNFYPFSHPHNPSRNQRGFTLLEIIVTIIISAVLATILAEVMSGQTLRSYQPVQAIEENLSLRAVMDNILSDYRSLRPNDPLVLDTLSDRIINGDYFNGDFTNGLSFDTNTGCIEFNADNEETPGAEPCNILKVTITVTGTQHSLTTLFTR